MEFQEKPVMLDVKKKEGEELMYFFVKKKYYFLLVCNRSIIPFFLE